MSGPLGHWRHAEVRRFAEIDSTNRYMVAEARAGAPDGTVAVADHQSAGRGRLDRRWEAPAGTALLASVLLRVDLRPADLFLCAAAVALAAADACRKVAGIEPSVKWPNDLLVDGRKLAGVLAELVDVASPPSARGVPGGGTAVVVGIGLNLTWPGPEGVGGTSLADEAGVEVERDVVLDALLEALAPRRRALEDPGGRRRLLDDLRQRCVTLGQLVSVELPAETIEGTATELTDHGHLVVRTATGPREITAGDVVHLRESGGRRVGQ